MLSNLDYDIGRVVNGLQEEEGNEDREGIGVVHRIESFAVKYLEPEIEGQSVRHERDGQQNEQVVQKDRINCFHDHGDSLDTLPD